MQLRPYQEEAVEAVFNEWEEHKSTLLIACTGAGKTQIFSRITQKLINDDKKVLIIAHRGELLEQARNRLKVSFGIDSALDKAEYHPNLESDKVVVASIQSISRDERLNAYPKDYFDAVIIDEAHHSAADTYLKVINYFDSAKLLGVTATPNRSDVRNISDIYESVAYTYDTKTAIDEGYLAPIVIRRIPVSIDISDVRTSCGDFVATDLENALEPYLDEIANQLNEKASDRKTIVFTPTIAIGEKMAGILNNKGISASCVSSNNTKEERANILNKLHMGEIQAVTNAMLLTEGFDEPSVDCIINLRATKSESLYRQILGRGLRLSPETNKKNLLVLDFLWHSGRKGYNVLSPIELFMDKSKIPLAETILNEGECEDLDELERKIDAETALAECIKNASKKFFLGEEFIENQNPAFGYIYNDNQLDCITIQCDEAMKFYTDKDFFSFYPFHKWELDRMTNRQKEMLTNAGIDVTKVYYRGAAAKLINTLLDFKKKNKCSFKQYKFLTNKGFNNVGKWSREDVSYMIDIISKNHWRVPYKINPKIYVPKSLKIKSLKTTYVSRYGSPNINRYDAKPMLADAKPAPAEYER